LERGVDCELYSLGRERHETDKKSYHVSADLSRLPDTNDLPSLLEDFHAREVLHVTFGSALAQYGVVELKVALVKHDGAYFDGLKVHFDKRLSLLK